MVGIKVFMQCFDDWNVVGYCCFEGNYDIFLLGGSKYFCVVYCEQCFVGCNYMFVIGDGLYDYFFGYIVVID